MTPTNLVDLHTHTTASDGGLSPAELVDLAREIGLKAVAVTDHDTTAGVEAALTAGREAGVEIISGLELSVNDRAGGMIHLLGYFIDHRDPLLEKLMAAIVESRLERNRKIVANLNRLGCGITLEEVLAISGPGNAGRPHIAQALINKGYVKDLYEAMDRYLGKGQPAYEDRLKFTLEEAVGHIHELGGAAVLAHPYSVTRDPDRLGAILERYAGYGLDGLEVFYPAHDSAFRQTLAAMAERLGLVATGGSDFHGKYKPDIRLGVGRGDLRIGYGVVEELKARLPIA